MACNWTEAQRQAIATRGGEIVVSAGAGAGKTAVLTERVLRMALEDTPLDRVLVITFTESAAHELKTRIAEALRAAARGAAASRARRQSLLVGASWISTIHAFCLRLLREHALAAGLSPFTGVQGPEDANLAALEAARDVVREMLQSEPGVRALVDWYADGSVETFVRLVRGVAEMVGSLPAPEAWLDARCRALEEGAFPEAEFLGFVRAEVARTAAQAEETAAVVRALDAAFAPWADYLDAVAAQLTALAARGDGLDGVMRALADSSYPRRPPVRVPPGSAPAGALAKKLMERLSQRVKEGLSEGLVAQTADELRAGELAVKGPALAMWATVRRFRALSRARRARRDLLSFEDMEHMALALLSGTMEGGIFAGGAPDVRFAEVLVDEFQDVNPVQDRLVALAAERSAARLFVVGDLKQSIYRFRLGEPRIFAGRITRISREDPDRALALQKNFRSRGALIELLNGMFAYLMTEALDGIGFDGRAQAIPGREEPVADSSFGAPFVDVHLLDAAGDEDEGDAVKELERDQREARLVAALLARTMREGFTLGSEKERRLLAWRDCAVLLRAVKGRMGVYTRELDAAGIPVRGPASGDPFEALEVRDLMALVRVLDNPAQDIPLAAVLNGPLGRVPLEVLALCREQAGGAVPFHAAALGWDGAPEVLQAFRAQLAGWRRLVRDLPLAEALWRILSRSGYMVYVAGLPGAARRRANVLAFMERARQFSSFERQGIGRFLLFLEDLEARGGELGPALLDDEGEDAVLITSVHQSKGLEWPVVVAAELGRRFNLRDTQERVICDRERGLGLRVVAPQLGLHYPTASHLLLGAAHRRECMAEELRLLYVAFTRARERLILVGSGSVDALRLSFTHPEGRETIPEYALLAARDPLAWVSRALGALGPARVAVEGEGAPCRVSFHQSPPEAPRAPPAARGAETPVTVRADPAVEALRRIFTYKYPHAAAVRTRAVMPVTALAQHMQAGGGGSRETPAPRFLRGAREITGRERGVVTHRFLEHVDLSAASLRAEFRRLAAAGVFTAGEEPAVDFDALEWFFDTPQGRSLREAPGAVSREVRFLGRVGAGGDAVLLRGVVDCVQATAGGLVVIDFKTDRVDAEGAPARAALYMPQLAAYGWALGEAWDRPIAAAHLVFLAPHLLIDVPQACDSRDALRERLEALVAGAAA